MSEGAALGRRRPRRLVGVYKSGRGFKAQIQLQRRQHYLGTFATEEEAARAYDAKALSVFGAATRTNFLYAVEDEAPPVAPSVAPCSRARLACPLDRRIYCRKSGVPRAPLGLADLQLICGTSPSPPLPSEAAQLDWRDQTYYWAGTLRPDEAARRWVWRGSWLGSFGARPSSQEILDASQTFEYVGQQASEGELPRSGLFSGHFMMHNDDSGVPERFQERPFLIEFAYYEGPGEGQATVSGRGDSDFGPFILQGCFDASSGKLDMCRKYLRSDASDHPTR